MHKTLIAAAITATLALSACSTSKTEQSTATMVQTQNPFLQASVLQYQAPDFSLIKECCTVFIFDNSARCMVKSSISGSC